MEKISIRTKNKNKISAAAKTAIENVLNTRSAEAIVFRAQYELDEVLSELNLDLNCEDAVIFASELRYQFANRFPNEPRKIAVSTGVYYESEKSPAFKKLRDNLTAFSAYRILDKILEYSHFSLEDLGRTGYLLRFKPFKENSTEEFLAKVRRYHLRALWDLFKNREGGTNEVALIGLWLEPYSADISSLFDEVMELKYPTAYNISKASAKEKPVTMPDTPVEVVNVNRVAPTAEQEVDVVAITVAPETTKVSVEEVPKELTQKQMLENVEIIAEYLDVLEKLKTAGITPEMIESKRDKVETLLCNLNSF